VGLDAPEAADAVEIAVEATHGIQGMNLRDRGVECVTDEEAGGIVEQEASVVKDPGGDGEDGGKQGTGRVVYLTASVPPRAMRSSKARLGA